MDTPFALVAEAVREIAGWEKHRIELTCWLAASGGTRPPTDIDISGWVARQKKLVAAADILDALARHEVAAAGILEALARHEAAGLALDAELSCALDPPDAR